MAEATDARTTPIYASYLTFATLLDWLRETKHVPSEFDRSFWSPKFSGTTGAQLIAGLRFLRLLDAENRPTARLEPIAFASTEERPRLVGEMLRDVYGADLVDGLPKMTTKMVSDRIGALGTTDATHKKAIAFFVNAAKAANVSMPAQIAKQARNRPAVSTRKESTKGRGTTIPEPKIPIAPRDNPSGIPSGLHAALMPFLADLAKIGPSWDDATYQLWKETWDKVLVYAYPVVGPAEAFEDGEGGE